MSDVLTADVLTDVLQERRKAQEEEAAEAEAAAKAKAAQLREKVRQANQSAGKDGKLEVRRQSHPRSC